MAAGSGRHRGRIGCCAPRRGAAAAVSAELAGAGGGTVEDRRRERCARELTRAPATPRWRNPPRPIGTNGCVRPIRVCSTSSGIDILSTLKSGDSLSRRSISRTEEDIASGVDITIMRDTTLRTYPASYSEVCDTFRPRLAFARRTDSGRERFIDFLVPSPVRSRFVAEHVRKEDQPASRTDFARRVLASPEAFTLPTAM